ncbi:MAG TPA: phage holin family protein [Candidatus Baltobacteraceae bacterium]|jgi:uncharacterized membrane protein YqjE
MHEPPESFGEALRRLPADLSDLIKAELRLVRFELRKELQSVARVAVGLGVAAMLGTIALLALSTAVVAALALTMPVWLAALIVGVAYAIVAGILATTSAAALRNDVAAPLQETQQHVKEDVAWIRSSAKSPKK